MEASEVEVPLWSQLLELAERGDAAALIALLDRLDETDRVFAFGHLDPEDRGRVLALLDDERAADVLEALPETQAAEAVEELAPDRAADILEALPSDERADLLGRLDEAEAEAILQQVEPGTAEDVRALLRFDPDSAGGRMVTEYVAVPETLRVTEVIHTLRAEAERFTGYAAQYIYAVGDQGELRGVVPLRDLLLAPPEASVASLMIANPISVRGEQELEEIFELFDHHAFVGFPVVDSRHILRGVLLREDVAEARLERAEAEQRMARGIVGGEELRSMPALTRSGRRLSWLSINVVLNIVAASVIAAYQETLQAAIALAVFLPIISDMSGCSGNQAVAVSLRELALGVTRSNELLRVWRQEVIVGAINGIALGLLLAGVAWLWQGNPYLGLVVGSSLAINTVIAVSIGGTVPLFIKRMGFDPALASGPVLTTVTDMCGFFLVLSLATVSLQQITA